MTSFLGWLILATLLCLPGIALFWPLFARGRRRYPGTRLAALAYAASAATSGLVLWFMIPLLVGWLFGRPAH